MLLSGITSKAQSIDTTFLDMRIREILKYHSVPGVTISIHHKNQFVYNKCFNQDVEEQITSLPPLYIGSVTKVITAVAIAKLWDMNLLTPDDHLTAFFQRDELPPSAYVDQITIRHLLHHHSGISKKSGYLHSLEFNGDLRDISIVYPPGQKGEYSSANQAILGMIIEKISGQTYQKFIEEHIFKPLNMNQSTIPMASDHVQYQGYCFAYGVPIKTTQMNYGRYIIPAGYAVTTPDDLNKMNIMLLNEGRMDTVQFIKSEIVKAIFTPFSGGKLGYGMSWGIGNLMGTTKYSHEGMTKISYASTVILPEDGYSISVFSNLNTGPFAPITEQVVETIVASIKGQNPTSDLPWEMIIRIAFGVLLIKMLFEFGHIIYVWKKAGMPLVFHLNFKNSSSLIFDLLPLTVLIVLPNLIKVPVMMMFRIMPDIGLSLLIGGILAIPTAFLKIWTKSNAVAMNQGS